MVMTPPTASRPNLVYAEPDADMRRGGGMSGERPLISYDEMVAMWQAGRGPQFVKYAIAMRPPNRAGQPGVGAPMQMPAEKFQKWFGQGYRPTKSPTDHDLYEFPEPPSPNRWLPSMVDDAISNGQPIPASLAPAGYIGPVFDDAAARTMVRPDGTPIRKRGTRAQAEQDDDGGTPPDEE